MHALAHCFTLSLAMLLTATPALTAQERSTRQIQRDDDHDRQRYSMTMTDDDRTLKVVLDGQIELNDDDTEVVSLGNGAQLVVEEHRRGEPARRIEFRRSGNDIRRTYTVNGEVRQPDADQKAWLARILPELVREQGLNAEPRVRRILRKEGADGVLREVRKIRSDGAKRTYLLLLLKHGTLSSAQTVALFNAASTIASDGDRSSVLLAARSRASRDAVALTALLESAGSISSDGDRTRVLVAVASAPALESAAARDAWFHAAGGISSDGDRSRALLAILHHYGARTDITVQALRSARQISSDGDKTRVLLAVAPEQLRDTQVVAAYDSALDSISSDGDHRRAELHVRSARR